MAVSDQMEAASPVPKIISLIPTRHKFRTLDALRGVAAITVVVFHYPLIFRWTSYRGYLAVDMFFVLSGFVLSYAYQDQLDRGLSIWKFLKARVIRLVPLYLLALVIGFVGSWFLKAEGQVNTREKIEYFFLNVLFVPIYSSRHRGILLYPFNNPSWTLLLELFINAVHAMFLRKTTQKTLAILCGGSGMLLVASVLHYRNQNMGWDWGTLFTGGIPRVLFSYIFGMLLYRLWAQGKRAINLPASLLLLSTFLFLSVPLRHEVIVGLILTLLVFPLVVFAGASNDPGRWTSRVFGALGAASYAIYVLHTPVYILLTSTIKSFTIWTAYLSLILFIGACLLLDVFYDAPVRKWLRRWS